MPMCGHKFVSSFILFLAVAFFDGYIDVFRPLEGKKKNNVPYYGLLTLARD